MGTPYNDAQRAFRTALQDTLRSHGMTPRMINQGDYPPGSPLPFIRQVIGECAGVIIVAFERRHIEKGAEKRKSPSETPIVDSTYTTSWNHIESALAYCLDRPLFIISERGLMKEGLIEEKIDWYVNEMEIDPARLGDSDFVGRLTAWREKIRRHRPRPAGLSLDVIDIDRWPVLEILARLSWRSWVEIFAIVAFLVSLGWMAHANWPSATH
jgi:hypothetical protein